MIAFRGVAERPTGTFRRTPPVRPIRGTTPPPEPATLVEEQALAIAETLATAADPREALHEFIARACEALEADTGSVFLRGDEPDTLNVVAASDEPSLARITVRLDRYPEVAAALASTDPIVVEDAPHNSLLREVANLIAARGIGSLVVFPVLVEGAPRGALLFRRTDPRAEATRSRLFLGRIAAAALGLAISGSRFREAIREQTNRILAGRVEQERRLRALERYRDLFESASDGVVVLDAETHVVYLNRAGAKMTGYSREGLTSRALTDIVAPHHRAMLSGVLAQAVDGAYLESFDLEVPTTSGDPLVVSASVGTLLSDPNVVILHFRDVTQARALELELRRTKEFVDKLIDSAADAIVAADRQGMVILFNKAAEQIYGYTAGEVVGRMSVESLYPPGVARQIMHALRGQQHGGVGRLQHVRQEMLSKTGQVIPVNLSAAIVYEEGEEVATIGTFSDLRDRLRIEERLRHAQEKLEISEKQSLVAELAGTTAHELNQPLTSIMGYAELVRRRLPDDDANRRALETILKEVERMAEIVKKIGRITRYETKAYVGGAQILDLDKAAGTQEPPGQS